MPHLTEIKESAKEVYDLEAHADGFWTRPMGYCALVVLLWGAYGENYASGRGQHCSGGIGAAQYDKLIDGLKEKANVLMVIVQGNSNDLLSFDKKMLEDLQTACRENNWTIKGYQANTSSSVVTRTGNYMTKDDYDVKAKVEAKNLAKCRCVLM